MAPPKRSKILVVDGFSVAYRAFYALPPTMTLKDGTPINAVLGFGNLLFNAIDQFNPDHVVICFDRREPTFRHQLFADYKAHRPPPPEDFVVQVPILKSFISELGIRILEKAGFEADDLMGTLSRMGDEVHMDTLLMTGDKDALQLVSDYTSVVMNQKGELVIYDPKEVISRFDLTPPQIIDLKSLQGDASDNIPGVPGIGQKTATKLLLSYSTLEGIYDNLKHIDSKSVQTKLSENKELAFLSQKLATIDRAVPIDVPLSEMAFIPNWTNILGCFERFEFRRLAERYQDRSADFKATKSHPVPKGSYTLIQKKSELKSILATLKSGFAIDLETTSKHAIDAQIVGIALCSEAGVAVYVALNQYLDKNTASSRQSIPLFSGREVAGRSSDDFKMNPILTLLKPILEDPKIPKFTQNGKYEWTVLHNYGITLRNIAFDTMLAAFLIDPISPVGLKSLAYRHLGIQMTTYEEVTGKGKDQVSFDQVDPAVAVDYAAADADITFQLVQIFKPLIHQKQLNKLMDEIELPTQTVLAKMESEGVCLDTAYLTQLSQTFDRKRNDLKDKIYNLSGTTFNINSTKQLAEILFDKMGLPVVKKTKTGRSTDSSVLEKLKDKSDIAQVLLDYRTIEKLQNTYVNALPNMVNPRTHRIHTSFNQTIAITGRLSSTAPNLQNIPIRTREGLKIRRSFVPSKKECWLFSADYSQVELRLMAHLSKDPNMIASFKNGDDIHTATAAIIENIPVDQVTKELRYKAKAVNFGIIYGISAFGLSENINISRSEAKQIIDDYFAKFPKIKTFISETISQSKKDKWVRTEFGRIRPLPEIDSQNPMRRQFAERTAVNTRLQGTAADLMKIAMIQIDDQISQKKLKSRMIIQVHDELVFDVEASEKDVMLNLVKSTMEAVVSYRVPLVVDTQFGHNWQDVS